MTAAVEGLVDLAVEVRVAEALVGTFEGGM
jgi:hypothetical protein